MKKNSAFQLRSGNKPSPMELSGVSPMKKDEELVKIPRKKIQKIDMKPFEEAAEGRHLINMEKRKRKRMTKLAKEKPELFFKTYNQSPSEYLSSLPYG
jgi:hypothetical protein|tara:strand:- start:51 stop:344 length:294 start_codon:yes stop_codon:yes gene_type:complete